MHETDNLTRNREMAAYEAMWLAKKATVKSIADQFRQNAGRRPSDFVTADEIEQALEQLRREFDRSGVSDSLICIHGSKEYPRRLRDAEHPVELLYYRGDLGLIEAHKSIAIIGSRAVSAAGHQLTTKLATLLAKDGFTIVSGLAKGVDTAAHNAAIHAGGRTISVLGTPITKYYPRENKALQELIAEKHLLVSQVPVLWHTKQDYRTTRFFFPERNITMSALAKATVIVEATDTSGTLVQATAALKQGRPLFIMNSNFLDDSLTWPSRFQQQGAIRVSSAEDICLTLTQ